MPRFADRCLPLVAMVFSCLCLPQARAEATWVEVRSPHFRVLTDGSASQGRAVAKEFEQMRQMFAQRFGTEQFRSGAPLTIVAARDSGSYRELEPAMWKARGAQSAGLFHKGWERQFAVIRLDTWEGQNEVVVYHEYTHSIFHANTRWLPVWADEGLAEFYAYSRFEGDRTYVGAPSKRMGEFRERTLIPVKTMLEVDSRSPFYTNDSQAQLFYAEAWAMVHYMIFGQGMGNGEKLNRFLLLLQEGTSQSKAFAQVFGDPAAFDDGLSVYLNRFTFKAEVMRNSQVVNSKDFAERKLTPAETAYELGCFHLGTQDVKGGRALIEKAYALDPKLAGVHEELGYLDFARGMDTEAVTEWKAALALDPKLPRSLFAVTMSGKPLADETPEELRETQQTLRRVTELDARFAPAFAELALLEWRRGQMQQAYNDAFQAETLEPWRPGYRMLTAHVLLTARQPTMAATSSRFVATHWFGPDHNEAVELWEAIPVAQRGDGPPLTLDLPKATQVVHGTLQEVSCSGTGNDSHFHVVVVPDGAAQGKAISLTSKGELMIGFSDTLWWGEDHFSPCHHLSGHQAMVAYRPTGSGDGELMDLEVRDDLPGGVAALKAVGGAVAGETEAKK